MFKILCFFGFDALAAWIQTMQDIEDKRIATVDSLV